MQRSESVSYAHSQQKLHEDALHEALEQVLAEMRADPE
jgi:hypothetical protein